MARLVWHGRVLGEYGGPLIIADRRDFECWDGTLPLPMQGRTRLEYWGQFSPELPEPYAVDSGHVRRDFASHDAMMAERDALIEGIRTTFPDATIAESADADPWEVMLPDLRQMWIEVGPGSVYALACDAGRGTWGFEYADSYGRSGSAAFFDKEGGGWVSIASTPANDELVLLRAYVNEDATWDVVKAFIDERTIHEVDQGEVLQVKDGEVFVSYSPIPWLALLGDDFDPIMDDIEAKGMDNEQKLNTLLQHFGQATKLGDVPRDLDSLEQGACSMLLRIKPGVYKGSYGHFESEERGTKGSWSAIWGRFTRV